jgi:pimeloyl-ACP methyl ester carboxylesterase
MVSSRRLDRAHLATVLSLVRWLGPWAGERVPSGVSRRTEHLETARGATMRTYVYSAHSAPRGVYLVAPGLHFLGPDDPRLDRFCRVLASAGFDVVAPLLPDFARLTVSEAAGSDLARAFALAERLAGERRLPRPAVFSISFGSLPAIQLAAGEAGPRVGSLLLFGGYAEFEQAVRFAITGRAEHEGRRHAIPHDPLNAPVVFLNVAEHVEGVSEDARPRLVEAWRAMVERTWGKAELKEGRAREPHARAVIAEHGLAEDEARTFLVGCGLEPGGEAMLEAALARLGDTMAWADPRPHLSRIAAPVTVVHGRDDDVIPFFEAEKLVRALPEGHPAELVLTGLYGHTGAALPPLADVAREVRALGRVVSAMARAPRSGRN